MTNRLRTAAALGSSALATAMAASLLQTELTLLELQRLGISVGLAKRLAVSVEDLARFAPIMCAFTLAAALIAWPLQALLQRWLRALPCWLIANTVALAVVMALLRDVIPMPAIAATRSATGLALVSLCGLVGGYVACRVSTTRSAGNTATARVPALLLAFCILLPAISFALMRPTPAQPPAPLAEGYRSETLLQGLERPWSLVELPDGRWLITEMPGRLQRLEKDGSLTEIAADTLPPPYYRGRTIGLMDVALSPAFAEDQRIYLTQGYRNQHGVGIVLLRARLQGHGGSPRLSHVETLFESTPKARDSNNGGRIAFIDRNTVLLTVGDGNARREEAQNPGNSLGKVMQLKVPPSGDSAATPAQVTATIYSRGHRNPQGIVHDPVTDAFFVTEHGPRGGDELNRLQADANYGWPLVSQGLDYPFARVSPFTRLPGLQDAEVVWTPSIAPSGLTVYQGNLFAGWHGDFLVPALRERGIRRIMRDGERIVGQQRLLAELEARIRDVRTARDGSLLVLTDGEDGRLLRLTPMSEAP